VAENTNLPGSRRAQPLQHWLTGAGVQLELSAGLRARSSNLFRVAGRAKATRGSPSSAKFVRATVLAKSAGPELAAATYRVVMSPYSCSRDSICHSQAEPCGAQGHGGALEQRSISIREYRNPAPRPISPRTTTVQTLVYGLKQNVPCAAPRKSAGHVFEPWFAYAAATQIHR